MKKVRLLDCTLRDGGFVNHWQFGEDCIINIFERLELAGIDIIEVGYLRDYVSFNADETQYPDTASIGKLLPPKINENVRVVAIIDYGECTLDRIAPCADTVLDGIRVTFKQKDIVQALEFCKKIKERGYMISLQPVSFMDYAPQDVLNLVEAANELYPFAVCIVDTYGFMNKRDLLRYFSLMDATLKPNIALGYHSHNNFQLAYSNAVELVEQFTEREMIVDCSVLGMGKGAGNAATELMVLYMNQNMGGAYDLDQVLEIADTYIEKERKKNYWGYSLKYYLAASNNCHHQYVSFLLNKKTLSIKSINEIISHISPNKKTRYDEAHIIRLYNEFQQRNITCQNVYPRLKEIIGDTPILIVAPGSSLVTQAARITHHIEEHHPYIISVNHISELYSPHAVFVSNHKRYSQIALRVKKHPANTLVIATSNINPTTLETNYILNYSTLLVEDALISDNATLMLINALIQMGVTQVSLAGFDGYKAVGSNYFDNRWDFMGKPWEQNQAIFNAVQALKSKIQLDFVTDTLYQEGDGLM